MHKDAGYAWVRDSSTMPSNICRPLQISTNPSNYLGTARSMSTSLIQPTTKYPQTYPQISTNLSINIHNLSTNIHKPIHNLSTNIHNLSTNIHKPIHDISSLYPQAARCCAIDLDLPDTNLFAEFLFAEEHVAKLHMQRKKKAVLHQSSILLIENWWAIRLIRLHRKQWWTSTHSHKYPSILPPSTSEYYLHPNNWILPPSQQLTIVARAIDNVYFDQTMRNRVLCSRGFPAIWHKPSLDNVALTDFCSARLHCFAWILGCIIPMPWVLAILWDTHRFLALIIAHQKAQE